MVPLAWAMMQLPGGPIGVALKLNGPFMHLYADTVGSILAERKRLMVILAWGRRRSHFVARKYGYTLANMLRKCALKVLMACSAALW